MPGVVQISLAQWFTPQNFSDLQQSHATLKSICSKNFADLQKGHNKLAEKAVLVNKHHRVLDCHQQCILKLHQRVLELEKAVAALEGGSVCIDNEIEISKADKIFAVANEKTNVQTTKGHKRWPSGVLKLQSVTLSID